MRLDDADDIAVIPHGINPHDYWFVQPEGTDLVIGIRFPRLEPDDDGHRYQCAVYDKLIMLEGDDYRDLTDDEEATYVDAIHQHIRTADWG